MPDWPEWWADQASGRTASDDEDVDASDDDLRDADNDRLRTMLREPRGAQRPGGEEYPPYDGLSDQDIFNYDDEVCWPIAACGHRHPLSVEPFAELEAPVVGGIYRVEAATVVRTASEVGRRPERVLLEIGSLVRCDARVGSVDARPAIDQDGYRFNVIQGHHTGRCIIVPDPGSTSEPIQERHGRRLQPGLPGWLVLVTPRSRLQS